MASMDLSLDDIIKKKFTKNPVKGKPGFKKFVGNNVGNNRPNPQANINRRQGGMPPPRRLGTQNAFAGPSAGQQPPRQTMGDARNRIIQKKRMQLTDARDKLCELAKRTDARQKLEKLRERRMGVDNALGPLGYNGYRMNLKRPLRSPINVTGRAGLAPGHIALQRTISQPIGSGRFHSKVPALMDMDIDLNDDYIPEGPLQLRRTVNNDQMRPEPLLRPSKLSSSSPYSWKAPQPRLTQSSSSRGYIDLDYPAEQRKRMKLPSPPPMMRPILVSDDEDMVEPVRPTVRSSRAINDNPVSGTKSRLESSRIQASSAPSGGSSGYRIVVSNLQNSVTHEDIRELFEDVGPLVASRLVRPGTAEVIYRQFKDAEHAVENYHNRQLDGQPMKCLLVKPRPSTASTAQPSSGSLRGPVASSSKLTGSGKSSVVPDISTIHKALFNKA